MRNVRSSETGILQEVVTKRPGIRYSRHERRVCDGLIDGLNEIKNATVLYSLNPNHLRWKPDEGYSMIKHPADVSTLFLPGILDTSQNVSCTVPLCTYRYRTILESCTVPYLPTTYNTCLTLLIRFSHIKDRVRIPKHIRDV